MNPTSLQICICGAGTMGSGIALVFALHGFRVLVFDVNVEILPSAAIKMEKELEAMVVKQKISSEQKEAAAQNIRFTGKMRECVADVIIEAIAERADLKLELFSKLAAINNEQTILATNTSSLSVTELAEQLPSPQRVAGMHFFNPATHMKLVEVVATRLTSSQTTETLMTLARSAGKTPVLCQDAPGFIVNHVARPYYLEALHMAAHGISDYETIDRLMEATGFKMGPFKLMDLIGNDINYSVSCIVHEALGRPLRLEPSPIQADMVNKKFLGRKTGKGYYEYPAR